MLPNIPDTGHLAALCRGRPLPVIFFQTCSRHLKLDAVALLAQTLSGVGAGAGTTA